MRLSRQPAPHDPHASHQAPTPSGANKHGTTRQARLVLGTSTPTGSVDGSTRRSRVAGTATEACVGGDGGGIRLAIPITQGLFVASSSRPGRPDHRPRIERHLLDPPGGHDDGHARVVPTDRRQQIARPQPAPDHLPQERRELLQGGLRSARTTAPEVGAHDAQAKLPTAETSSAIQILPEGVLPQKEVFRKPRPIESNNTTVAAVGLAPKEKQILANTAYGSLLFDSTLLRAGRGSSRSGGEAMALFPPLHRDAHRPNRRVRRPTEP